MIKNIIIFSLLFPLSVIAQKKTLTYDQAKDIKFAEQYKNNTVIDSYTTKDGLIICVGDTLTVGDAVIKRKTYLFNDVFSHIVLGKTKGRYNKEYRYLPHRYSGNKVVVKSLFVTHEKYRGYKIWPDRRAMPLYVSVFVKNLNVDHNSEEDTRKVFLHSRKTILDIERALSSGEIINPNARLSREEAIKKLKESKDLMELGFLSKEEYEQLKEKLTPIILDK